MRLFHGQTIHFQGVLQGLHHSSQARMNMHNGQILGVRPWQQALYLCQIHQELVQRR